MKTFEVMAGNFGQGFVESTRRFFNTAVEADEYVRVLSTDGEVLYDFVKVFEPREIA